MKIYYILVIMIFLIPLNDLMPVTSSTAASSKKKALPKSPSPQLKKSTQIQQVVDASTYKESKPTINEKNEEDEKDDDSNEEQPIIDQVTTWIKENKIAAGTIFILIIKYIYPKIQQYIETKRDSSLKKQAEEKVRLDEQLKKLSPAGIKETLTKAFDESVKGTKNIKELILLHKAITTDIESAMKFVNTMSNHANANKNDTFDSNALASILTSFNEIKNTYETKIKNQLITLIKEKLKDTSALTAEQAKEKLEQSDKVITKEEKTTLEQHATLQAEEFLKK